MNLLPVQALAQTSVERVLNALPEGLLIAFFAWALLRVIRRQNSGTRFAVWFLALLTVVALPLLSGAEHRHSAAILSPMSSVLPSLSMRPAITISGHWALLLFLAWALGAFIAMVRLASGLWRLRQLRRSCSPLVAQDFDPVVCQAINAIVASSSVTIATSDSVRVPAAIGFWKRTIILPTWALEELPPADLNVILLHEFAHLRRWDDWTNLIQKILRSLFFFHPAVWWIEQQLSVEREMACDDAVLAQTANPHGYATCLISLLEKSLAHRGWSMAQAAVHRAHEASLRLKQILDENRPSATRVWKPALGMVAAFSMICMAGSLHAPQLVAFDRATSTSSPDHVNTITASQPSLQLSPQLSPRTSGEPRIVSWSDGRLARPAERRRPTAVAERQPVRSQKIDVALTAVPPRPQATMTHASLNQELVPEFQTLVFFQATQYGTANSPMWRVQVWQVTFVNAVFERTARVPVANSI